MNVEKYIAFRRRPIFLTVYSVDKEKIGIKIYKNVTLFQPYSKEWHNYINKTCLKIYPYWENPLRIFYKLYNMKKLSKPTVKAFQTTKQHKEEL